MWIQRTEEYTYSTELKVNFHTRAIPLLQIIQERAAQVWVSHKRDNAMRGNERGEDEEVQLLRCHRHTG